MDAIRLIKQGKFNQAEIARRLKVCRQTVSRWAEEFAEGGREALKMTGRAGRKPELSEEDRERLTELLLKGPEAAGYETPLWTCRRIAHLIGSQFDVSYHPGHVWKLLDSMGWSCQRPEGRARERNEEEIRYWKRVRWPQIKKKPTEKGARSFSSTKAE